MFSCPRCRRPLARITGKGSNYWECEACHGHAINLTLLRKRAEPAAVNRLWQASQEQGERSHLLCPSCQQAMRRVNCVIEQQPIELEVCQRCHFVWFDPAELKALPERIPPPEPPKKELPQEAKEALAMMEIERIREESAAGRLGGPDAPDYDWQLVAGVLGMPVEHDQAPLQARPVATWAVSAMILVVSCLVFATGRELLLQLAFIPSEAWRFGGLTWISAFFVHGGIFHLVGNLYFLLVFGDNVEDLIGRTRFLTVLLLSTLLGGFLHLLADPTSSVPAVGASGGISGIIALYALAFPQAKLGMLFRVHLYFRWIKFSARTGFVLRLGLQLVTAWMQLQGQTRVSAFAHLGGCLVGVLYWFLFGGAKKERLDLARARPAGRP